MSNRHGLYKNIYLSIAMGLLVIGLLLMCSCDKQQSNPDTMAADNIEELQEEDMVNADNNSSDDSDDGILSVDSVEGSDIDYGKYADDSVSGKADGNNLDKDTSNENAVNDKSGSKKSGNNKSEINKTEKSESENNKSDNRSTDSKEDNNSTNKSSASSAVNNNTTDKMSETDDKPINIAQNSASVQPDKPAPVEPEDAVIDNNTTYTCSLYIDCKTILDNMDKLEKGKSELVPPDGIILAKEKIPFNDGESVFDVLLRVTREEKIHMEYSYTPVYNSSYIEGIANLYEFDCGELSGWIYQVNDWIPNYGVSRYQLKDGDVVRVRYTCDLGKDSGLVY